MSTSYHSTSGSRAEDLFIELFSEAFGPEKAGFLYSQYPFYDIYQGSRFADFLLENGGRKIAIEIDDEASHSAKLVSRSKFYDDRLKQNSMIFLGWDVYRWAVRQMQEQPETVKDELRVFLGRHPAFREIQDYMPTQKGKTLDGSSLELKEHQKAALASLEQMRSNHETIALLHHATGTGKTVTAVMDAKRLGKRTLFLAHSIHLVDQAVKTFRALWPEASVGYYGDGVKEPDSYVVCGSVQSVALDLDRFRPEEFGYLIVDEAHHAATDTYQKVLAFFAPEFTLGLTATPERMDGKDILDIFKNTAHKLDIQTAVEIGELASVRCIRIHTNIDLTKVRFNSVRYNIRDLESKIYVPERNQLIVDTWLQYVRNKRTVIFCASVKHAQDIAGRLYAGGVAAEAVSGDMKPAQRRELLAQFEAGGLKVLCACDLLNEGWDCPATEVLFMARPTMSKILYTQQLGRGMRKYPGKDYLMVFDFVDNASQYNMPYSMHRMFRLKDYRPGEFVLSTAKQRAAERELYDRGERPDALIDWPVHALDYELVDLFNWQEEAAGMYSQQELIRHLSVQKSQTIEEYVRHGEIVPDLVVDLSGQRQFKYYKKERVEEFAQKFGWTVISDDNRYELFMDMIRKMLMDHSYKPVLIKAILHHADKQGRVSLANIVSYFRNFYEARRAAGLIVEQSNSIFARGNYTDSEAQRNILANPFKRFEDMQVMYHTKTLGIIQVDESVWKRLTGDIKEEILQICDEKLEEYYARISK